MTRRSILTAVTGILAALTTKVKGAKTPEKFDINRVRPDDLLHKARFTDHLSLARKSPDDLLGEAASLISEKMNEILASEGLHTCVHWTNIASTIDNPLLDNGRFYITVYKKKTVA